MNDFNFSKEMSLEEFKLKLKSYGISPPNLINPPTGCRFKARCPFEINKCNDKPDRYVNRDREAICWRTSDQKKLLEESKKLETWEIKE